MKVYPKYHQLCLIIMNNKSYLYFLRFVFLCFDLPPVTGAGVAGVAGASEEEEGVAGVAEELSPPPPSLDIIVTAAKTSVVNPINPYVIIGTPSNE